MSNAWRIFTLLMWKNFIVRRRHWIHGLLIQFCVPLILFVLTQIIRDNATITNSQHYINETTYPILTKEELFKNFENNGPTLYFSPRNDFTEDLMERTQRCLSMPEINLVGFSSEDELLNTYVSHKINGNYMKILAVTIKNSENHNSALKHLEYIIRHEYSLFDGDIHNFGFSLPIQMCLDESFLELKLTNSLFKNNISMQRMPIPAHLEKEFNSNDLIKMMYGIIAIAALYFSLTDEITFVTNEKSLGLNILMAMNGVKYYQNLLSWLISGLLISMFYIIPRLVLLNISFTSKAIPFLNYGDTFLVAIMHFVHIVHLLAFGYHVSSYFSMSILRALVTQFLYFGSFALQMYISQKNIFTMIPYFGIFFPNILLYRIYEEIFIYEEKKIGVGWSTLFETGDMNYKTAGSLGVMLIFSILGTFLHFFLALYAYSLFPGKYGVSKHPLYFLKFFKSRRVSSEEELFETNHKMEGTPFEPVPEDIYIPGIQIRNLKKSYIMSYISREEKQALSGISINFYKGQITTLLGHNGAGKTTLMSILTGSLSPTEGMVLINGKNINDEMDKIVINLGLCPQEDILFPDLTVFEQIEFFGLLKNGNKTNAEVRNNVTDLLEKLKLAEKRNEMSVNLSGGQKRRVCLGMAMISDASTLILDEPTSGMDPETRREVWDILLKLRREKTILISTHNMEEADVLGDRTAIIELGKLKSYGTPMFLKKFYGEGNIELALSTVRGYNVEKIRNQLSEESQLINFEGERVVFSIPNTDRLPDDLDRIEEHKKELGVTGINVSHITLEQVFLRATKEDDGEVEVNGSHMEKINRVEGFEQFSQSAMALLGKKLTYTYKNKIASLFMILIPLLSIFLVSLSFGDFDNSNKNPVHVQLDMYSNPNVFFSSNDKKYGKMYTTTAEGFDGKVTNVGNINISKAILDFGRKDLAAYRNYLIAAASFEVDENSQEIKATALYTNDIIFSVPISFNLVSNAIIKVLLGREYQIDVSDQEFPSIYKLTRIIDNNAFSYIRATEIIMCIAPSFALYVINPLRESSYGIKQLQRMTGVASYLYWGTFFIFDIVYFIVSMILMLIGFYLMDIIMNLQFFYSTEISIMLLLVILFGINTFPIVYIFSFWKKSKTTIINILSFLPLLTIGLEAVLGGVMMVIVTDRELFNIITTNMRRIFLLVPSISFYYGLISFFDIADKNSQCRKVPEFFQDSVCTYDGKECCKLDSLNGRSERSFAYFGDFRGDTSLEECIIYLCVTCLIYFIILGLSEEKIITKFFMKSRNRMPLNKIENIDDQVKAEKSLVASVISKLSNQGDLSAMQEIEQNINEDSGNFPIYLAYELCKYYGNLPAVKEISFSVKKSECFGLLGVNGAGKSTTFRMLTGEEIPHSGIMYLNGKEISINRREYLAQMGYCPQNSALIKSLNSKDHLKLFAFLRGVPKCQVSSEVGKWISRLNLKLCADRPCGTYSGGNKRRLSIAIALIGNPNLVLLDEPTTGVDPAARRSLWSVIKSCQLAGQSIVLTSHSMEECEALCDRLVIMVGGQLVCIGPSEQLKQRFGAGYDINIKLNPERSNLDVINIKRDMEDALECELRDEHVGYITYHVNNSITKWKTMYGVMKHLKGKYSCIEDYSVLSATLEQLFLQFARAART